MKALKYAVTIILLLECKCEEQNFPVRAVKFNVVITLTDIDGTVFMRDNNLVAQNMFGEVGKTSCKVYFVSHLIQDEN